MISDILKSDIEEYAQRILRHPLLNLARRGHVSPETASFYLSNARYLVGHTLGHTELARRCAQEQGRTELARYYARKVEEETGHDRWAEADLETMSDLFGTGAGESPSSALVEQMAYLEQAIRAEPASYLAYALHAEYFTVLVGPEWVSMLDQRCGVPERTMTVVTRHVELDKAHVQRGLDEINALVGDAPLLPVLRTTMQGAQAYFARFVDEVYDHARRNTAYRRAS
jgi:pyrroloquinoline quinone (PQQ) biosynthesis protein C